MCKILSFSAMCFVFILVLYCPEILQAASNSLPSSPAATVQGPGPFSPAKGVVSAGQVRYASRTETPLSPENLQIFIVGASNVILSWDAVTQDVLGNPLVPDGYAVYFSPSPQSSLSDYTHLADVSSLQYFHGGAAISYPKLFYVVTAFINTLVIPPNFVLVPGGSFVMGDTRGGGGYDERPPHTVALAPFCIGQYEVTQAEWFATMGYNPVYNYGVGSNFPDV